MSGLRLPDTALIRWPGTRLFPLFGSSLLVLGASQALAQSPANGRVIAGNASISQTSTRSTITQTTDRAVIRWSGFDVGRNHTVVFNQPSNKSATLNRVISARGSVIEGAITAPGTVIIQNSAGVLFTPTAKVETGGMVATSQWVDSDPFMASGRLGMGTEADQDAPVINRGEITVRDAGIAALVGARVDNSGTIIADKGTVALASGRRTTIDISGDGTFRVAVIGSPASGAGIVNSGTIDVGGGKVMMTAGNVAQALDNVINTTGVIRATSGTGAGGQIQLTGQGTGRVRVAGTVEASGRGRGGEVSVSGAIVHVAGGASVAANGDVDGGTIRLGNGTTRRADRVNVERGARIAARGTTGTGGSIIAGSDLDAAFDGVLDVSGGTKGGAVETVSLGPLAVGDAASVTIGQGGSWRIGTSDALIEDGAIPRDGSGNIARPAPDAAYRIHRLAVVEALNGGADVTVEASGGLAVNDALGWSGAADLVLRSGQDMRLAAGVHAQGAGAFTAAAGRDFENAAAILSDRAGDVTVTAGRTLRFGASIGSTDGDLTLTATAGDIVAGDGSPSGLGVTTVTGKLLMEATAGSVRLARSTAGELQVASGTGDIQLRAGAGIEVEAGGAGSPVRIGDARSGADVRLTAADISVGGDGTEVVTGTGGDLVLRGGESIGIGEGARVAALGGATLELQAARQTWNGEVSSGTGASDGGNTLISGAITSGRAQSFSLKSGADFVLAAAAPGGATSSYQSDRGLRVTTSGAGTASIGGPVTARTLLVASQAGVSLGTGALLRGTGSGDALVVAAGARFENAAGADALGATGPDGRWLLYMDDFDSLTGEKPVSGTHDLYGRSYAEAPPSSLSGFAGNRTVYGETPVLHVTAGSGRRTYGGAVLDLGYRLDGLRAGDSAATALAGTPTVRSDGNQVGSDAGSYATTATASASAQGYRLEYEAGTLVVDRAGLIVTPTGTRTYGSTRGTYGAAYDGLVAGDTADDLGGALAFATSATQASDVGTYDLGASGLTSGNYVISYAPGTLRIDPAALTVSVNDARKTYGNANPDFTARYDGLVLGQDRSVLGGALVYATPAGRGSDVGSYGIEASGLTSGNYTISYVPGTLRIDPAALRVTVNDTSKTYGDRNPDFSARYDGFVLGQDKSVLGGDLRFATAAGTASDVGGYQVTAAGQTSGNYAITYAPGTLRIDKAALRVSVNDASRTYGQNNPDFGVRYDGFVLGQGRGDLGGSLRITTPATAGSDVGSYGVAASGLTSGNYAITYDPGTLRIDKAALRVTVNDTSKTYGDDNPAFGVKYDGFVLGQGRGDLGGALGYVTKATKNSDVGSYGVLGTGLTSGNYDISYAKGTLRIDKAALRVSVNDASRTYGQNNPDFGVRYDGFVLGQGRGDLGGSLRITTPATASSDVGSYGVAASGLTSGNYAITYDPGTLRIDKAALRVTVNDTSKTYGDDNPTFGVQYDGFVLGQGRGDLGGALGYVTKATKNSDVGSYGVLGTGLTSGNYDISYAKGTLRIDKAALRVSVNDASRTYGQNNPDFGVRYDGFVLGQGRGDLGGSLRITTPATASSDVGSYGVAASGLTSGNYAITYDPGTLRIDPARLTITTNDATKRVGQPNPVFSVRYDGFVLDQDRSVLGGTLSITTRATQTSPVGRYDLNASGLRSANYAITYVHGHLTITPAAIAPRPSVGTVTLPFATGVAPNTPGDATFRTKDSEAPPVIGNAFDQSFSLGQVSQLTAPGAEGFVAASGEADTPRKKKKKSAEEVETAEADNQGFVAASGVIGEIAPISGQTAGAEAASGANGSPACAGAINTGATAGCGVRKVEESFWSIGGGVL